MNVGLTINPDVSTERLDDIVVLLNAETDVIYELNETAGRLWECLASGMDLERSVQQLTCEFEVDADTARTEAERVIGELAARDFIRLNRSI